MRTAEPLRRATAQKPYRARAAHPEDKKKQTQSREPPWMPKARLFGEENHGRGEDHDAPARILLRENALPVGGVARGMVEPNRRVEKNHGDGADGERDHRQPEDGQLACGREARGKVKAEEPGKSERHGAAQREQGIERPDGRSHGQSGEQRGPGHGQGLLQHKTRAPEKQRDDDCVDENLGADPPGGRQAGRRRSGHFEGLRRRDAGNRSLHREKSEQSRTDEVFEGEQAEVRESFAAAGHQWAA